MSAALDTRRNGSAPASARDDAQASCTAMFQSSRRPLFKDAAERGALAAGGGAAKPHPKLSWMGLVAQRALFITVPAVHVSNGDFTFAAKTALAILQC